MYYLTYFKHFVSIFPSFSIQLTPFSINFKFLTPHFYKSLDPIGSIFFHVLYPGTENLMKYPPRNILYENTQYDVPYVHLLGEIMQTEFAHI